MNIPLTTLLRAVPLTVTLGWLCLDSPVMFATEAQFALQVLLVTLITRSVDPRTWTMALSMGIGVAAPLVTLTGIALARVGIDVDNGAGNWLVVPLIEETLKLAPVAFLAWRHTRRTGLAFNASDWFVVAAMSGAGFALVENAYLSHHDLVYRYGPQAGPLYLFPTAWGYAGYLGHGAATAFVGLGIGLAVSRPARHLLARFWWAPAAAAFAWITLEHGLANMFYSERLRGTLALGAGRATPAIFLVLLAAVVAIDAVRARATLARSPRLQRLFALLRADLRVALGQPSASLPRVLRLFAALRLLNRVAAMPAPPEVART